MPVVDEILTKEFSGKVLDPLKLSEQEWSDQGGSNYHFGFPQKKGMWLKRIESANPCGHHTIWLFVMLHLGKDNTLKQVSEAVHMVYPDGSFDDMGVGFFPPDVKTAKKEISRVLVKNIKV
jgi:hypothetical protein